VRDRLSPHVLSGASFLTGGFQLKPPEAPTARALLARSPVESERRFGTVRAFTTRVRGQRTAAVTFGK
jgi:hypothetical protein